MKDLFLNGVQPDNRSRASLILLIIFTVMLMMHSRGMIPATLDRLPAHAEVSSGDSSGSGVHNELVAFDEIFNQSFDYLNQKPGLSASTSFIANYLKKTVEAFNALLLGGGDVFITDAMPWIAVVVVGFILGFALNGWKLSLLTGGTFLFFAFFGQWVYSMQTLALLFVSAPVAIIIGMTLGVLAYKQKAIEVALLPILNVAGTLPHFVYLILAVVFFGIGLQTGAIATIIFAVPPMVCQTMLGLRKVPLELKEAGKMSGCSRWQLLFNVEIPCARHEIRLGVNQAIVQCLAMVVIAALIGAPGLGQQFLTTLQTSAPRQAVEIAIGILLLAITLNSLSLAWAEKNRDYTENFPFYLRYRYQIIFLVGLIAAYVAARYFPVLRTLPLCDISGAAGCYTVSSEAFWEPVVDWIAINWYDGLLTFRSFIEVELLAPLRDLFLYPPAIAVIIFLVGAGFILGGWYSALLTALFFGFVAVSGWWDRAMITAYMVMFSVCVCMVIGVPLGIWASRKPARAQFFLVCCDGLQAIPAIIYLLPVIMLFQVSELSAILSVIVYATQPVVRYSIEGILSVPASLREAAVMSGCNARQRLFHLELPIAMPQILLGINKSVMSAFSMVVLAAVIGTVDLGQAIFQALLQNDLGKSLTVGLCISFMALSVNHLITRWVRGRQRLLGLD